MTLTVQRLEIHGRVQGVGYRWAMAEQAVRLGVRGWVRNRRDGTVEAMVTGTPESVQRLIEWARHGPPAAAVTRVDVLPGAGEFDTFDLRPTA
jgi:acylphosphatase